MGLVWVARHMLLDIDVAVKFMSPLFIAHAEMRARFEREAKAAALLRSPYVVQVYDYGVEEDTPYIVMELLEGEDLHARLKRERNLTPLSMAKIVVPVCKALRRAHDAGLVHRDLKPANIFLATNADEETVKILDFGIVKATGTTLPGLRTSGPMLMGSPQYMAPEQVLDHLAVDHRADLWSLGIILFRCLVGRNPFASKGHADLLLEICSGQVPSASALAPGLGPDVDRFFERALARDPAQRFQTAAELAEAFVSLSFPPEAPERGEAAHPAKEAHAEPEDAATLVRPTTGWGPSTGEVRGSDPSAQGGSTPLLWSVEPLPIFSIGGVKADGLLDALRVDPLRDPRSAAAEAPSRRRARWLPALTGAGTIALGAALLLSVPRAQGTQSVAQPRKVQAGVESAAPKASAPAPTARGLASSAVPPPPSPEPPPSPTSSPSSAPSATATTAPLASATLRAPTLKTDHIDDPYAYDDIFFDAE